MFINLLTRSYYTLLGSYLSVEEIINYAIKNKQKFVSIIDKNNLFCSYQFYKLAKKNNLIPIIGIDIDFNGMKYILIAKNFLGLKNINKISSNLENSNFDFNKYLNDVILISDDENIIAKYKFKKSEIALSEVLYENEEDWKKLKILSCIKNNILFNDENNDEQFKNKFYINNEDINNKFSHIQLENLDKLLNLIEDIDYKIEKKINLVEFCNESNKDIKNKALENLNKILDNINDSKLSNIYLERLKSELDVIEKMSFSNYFLIVQDYIIWAKQNDIYVGPGRGSVGGSLVAYCLGITEVDPIKYDLIFERFLNIDRKTMPDIDIDFEDCRRNEVVNYISKKYENKVANIITFQRNKIKAAIRDVGRVMNIELEIINKISKLINIEINNLKEFEDLLKNNNELNKYFIMYKDLFINAISLLNFPRQIGMHAAGIVISEDGLENICPTILNNGNKCTQFSMEYLEELGLIKFDILGLSNLTTIKNIINEIKKTHPTFRINDIDYNDNEVYKKISSGDTIGIFQLESTGMTNCIKRIKPKNIEEISLVIAAFRPGAMKMIDTLVENKNNLNNIKYINNRFVDILKPTYGVIIYQEQIMEIIKQVANYSFAKADIFRRIISKKDKVKLQVAGKEFIKDALENGYDEDEVNEIYKYICDFADYGFNKSHSISYSIISYILSYLKFKYPYEFFIYSLNSAIGDNNSLNLYKTNAFKYGINIYKPDICTSECLFKKFNNNILSPLTIIKGINSISCEKIISIRKDNFINCIKTIALLANNKIPINITESLLICDCFENLIKNDKLTKEYLVFNLLEIYNKSKILDANSDFVFSPNLEEISDLETIKKTLNEKRKTNRIEFWKQYGKTCIHWKWKNI